MTKTRAMNNEYIENSPVPEKSTSPIFLGPGAHLRAARERQGLSVEDIARKLCLTSNVVQQIEDNNYKAALAVTFIRGYLRSYAKLVDVDPEILITEFNALGLQDTPPSMSTQRIYHRETSIINKATSWISTIVGIGVLLVLVVWIHSKFVNNPTVSNVATNLASTMSAVVSGNKANKISPITTNTTSNNDVNNHAVDESTSNSTLTTNHPSNLNIINNQTAGIVQQPVSGTMNNNVSPTTTDTASSVVTSMNQNLNQDSIKEPPEKLIHRHKINDHAARNTETISDEQYTTHKKSTTEHKQKIAMPF